MFIDETGYQLDLTQHWGERTRELTEARGAELWFLLAYSPDLNPIEEAFSKLKTLLREAAARTHEAIVASIWSACKAATASDTQGYFTHCGYPPLAQQT